MSRQSRVSTSQSSALEHAAEYLRQLRKQTRWIGIRGMQVVAGKAYGFGIDHLHTPLTISGGEVAQGPEAERRSILLEDARKPPLLLVEGDPRAGKTTFLRHASNCRH